MQSDYLLSGVASFALQPTKKAADPVAHCYESTGYFLYDLIIPLSNCLRRV